jgi:hypothetical protein
MGKGSIGILQNKQQNVGTQSAKQITDLENKLYYFLMRGVRISKQKAQKEILTRFCKLLTVPVLMLDIESTRV